MNIHEVLTMHAEMYPEMRPADAVKLIYQNEFGGGHLVTDPERSLAYLLSEAERTPANESLALCVPIGNGMVRVNIAAVTAHRVDFVHLNNIFVESANRVRGTVSGFTEKLEILKELAASGIFSFTSDELESYINEYIGLGFPAVSHSQTYRENYAPAYRVVLESLLEAEKYSDDSCPAEV